MNNTYYVDLWLSGIHYYLTDSGILSECHIKRMNKSIKSFGCERTARAAAAKYGMRVRVR